MQQHAADRPISLSLDRLKGILKTVTSDVDIDEFDESFEMQRQLLLDDLELMPDTDKREAAKARRADGVITREELDVAFDRSLAGCRAALKKCEAALKRAVRSSTPHRMIRLAPRPRRSRAVTVRAHAAAGRGRVRGPDSKDGESDPPAEWPRSGGGYWRSGVGAVAA
jgi:hypothetical protein